MNSIDYDYPTDDELAILARFSGTPEGFVDHVRNLWWIPAQIGVEDGTNEWGAPVKLVSFVTGGWSGNESLIGVILDSFFHISFWVSSHRGGLYIYEVLTSQWSSGDGFLGTIENMPTVSDPD